MQQLLIVFRNIGFITDLMLIYFSQKKPIFRLAFSKKLIIILDYSLLLLFIYIIMYCIKVIRDANAATTYVVAAHFKASFA